MAPEPDSEPEPEPDSEPESEPPCSSLRILVVDDMVMNRRLLIYTLRRALHAWLPKESTFVEVGTGEGALELLRSGCFDVAILDEYLSKDAAALKGTDVTRLYRAIETSAASRMSCAEDGSDGGGDGGSDSRERTWLSTVIIGLTVDAGLVDHSELAASVGQDAVWGKPFPNGDQMARELIELLRNRRRVA